MSEPVTAPTILPVGPLATPLVIADDDTYRDYMRTAHPDVSVYYVLANDDTGATRLFKVVDNVAGWAVGAPTKVNLGLPEIKEQAFFGLPLVPGALIDKIDAFFRLVEQDLGTEAIVLLTFDPTMGLENPDGWGVCVPSQANTSAFCDYDPTSIVEDKPDHVVIVGSAHSHPHMSAHASSTDHKDQADFDGVHFTFGYPGSMSKLELYAEIQMGGTIYKIDADKLLADPPVPAPDDDLKAWRAKVTKGSTYTSGYGGYGTGYGSSSSSSSSKSSYSFHDLSKPEKRAPGSPDPNKFTVLTDVLAGETDCPLCARTFGERDKPNRKCGHCFSFLAFEGESIDSVVAARRQISSSVYELGASESLPTKTLVWWHRRLVNNGTGLETRLEILYDHTTKTKTRPIGGTVEVIEAASVGVTPGTGTEFAGRLPFGSTDKTPELTLEEALEAHYHMGYI